MGQKIVEYLDERVRIRALMSFLLNEPMPGGSRWAYIPGSMVLFVLILQFITGMMLAFYYGGTPDHAWDSVNYIDHLTYKGVPVGRLIRGIHYWGSSIMVIAVGIHLLQVFLWGAYKRPREIMWLVGTVLLALTMTAAFSGYLLPWDERAYWGTIVGTNMIGLIPLVGEAIKDAIRGGVGLGALTLSHFFTLHTMILPTLFILFVMLHMVIFRRVGPAGPFSGTPEQNEATKDTFYPRQVLMDSFGMMGVFILILILAILRPPGLESVANPSNAAYNPTPAWYFDWIFQLLKMIRPEIVGVVGLPVLIAVVLVLLPFLDKKPVRSPFRRPLSVLSTLFVLVSMVVLSIMAENGYKKLVDVDRASMVRGQVVFNQSGCIGCHTVFGKGGKIGPDLSEEGLVGHSEHWLTVQFVNSKAHFPDSIMPDFTYLTKQQQHDLAMYISSLGRMGWPDPTKAQ
ncbi:MAG: cytochrome b N-terminal domain-containing protein [Nitrospiraceae bacterium]|nr:cytochrome b N-terminal domain-containing protein [Nitrospiraceae bacterium]